MAVVKMVKAWRGVTRNNLRRAAAHLQSLLNFDAGHAALVPRLFTNDERDAVIAVNTVLNGKLSVTKPK